MTVRACPTCRTELHAPLLEFHATDRSMSDERRNRLCHWVTEIGVDPNVVKSGYVLLGDAGFELHLTEMVRGDNGQFVSEVKFGQVVGVETTDRIVQLGPVANWPGAEVAHGDHPGDAPPGR